MRKLPVKVDSIFAVHFLKVQNPPQNGQDFTSNRLRNTLQVAECQEEALTRQHSEDQRRAWQTESIPPMNAITNINEDAREKIMIKESIYFHAVLKHVRAYIFSSRGTKQLNLYHNRTAIRASAITTVCKLSFILSSSISSPPPLSLSLLLRYHQRWHNGVT